jgi:hypothetical protein
MKNTISLFCLILLSCGGGGGSNTTNPDPTNQINFTGTGGDFQAAQPIDID